MRIRKHGSKRHTRAGVAAIEYVLALTFVACMAFVVSEVASLATTQFQDVADNGLIPQEKSTGLMVSHKVGSLEDPVASEEPSFFSEQMIAVMILASTAVGVGVSRKL